MSERDEDIRQRFKRLFNAQRVAMLTTLDEEGRLRSRPMVIRSSGLGGNLWLFTRADSLKVRDAQQNRQVNISYTDSLADRYVSISGIAHVEPDRARMRVLWSPTFTAWFPRGLDEPNLVLLRVEVQQAELWDAGSNRMVEWLGIAKDLVGLGSHPTPVHETLTFAAGPRA